MLMVVGCTSVEFQRSRLRVSDGTNLSVLESSSDRPVPRDLTIVFLPGWSMPASIWQPQLEYFGDRYRVLALDPRGQGESDVPETGFTAERRAADIDELLQPLDQVVLVGWSLGALEALQYIDMFGSDRLAAVVLVDSSVGEEPVPPSETSFLDALKSKREETLRGFVKAIIKSPLTDAQVATLVKGAQRMSVEQSLALLSYPFERTHWKRIAHAFSKPLLYVVTPMFAEQAENLKNNRPGTQIELFRDAGHTLFVDEPDRFNQLLREFIERLPRR